MHQTSYGYIKMLLEGTNDENYAKKKRKGQFLSKWIL
jgi:hypothetical protein